MNNIIPVSPWSSEPQNIICMKTQTSNIEIIITEDYELLRKGFIMLLQQVPGISLIGEAANGMQLLELLETRQPDVILMDINMPVMDGITATRIISKKYPSIGVLVLSTYNHEYNIIKMVTAGAKGHVPKYVSQTELVEAIKTVHANDYYYEKRVSLKLNRMIEENIFDPGQNQFCFHFTPRETEILRLICMEKTNREICNLFNLSIRTVEDFRQRLNEKTGSSNSVGLVMFAMRYGIYDPDCQKEYLDAMSRSAD